MAFNVRKRGKLTYYYEGDRPVLSALVTEEQTDGDLKIHFAGLTGAQPKTPNILADPAGYAAEQDRLRKAYAEAYSSFFADNLPENGVPCRFTVHLIDFPDKAASYEFYSIALLQRALQKG